MAENEDLVRQVQLGTIAQLSASLAHDLRNPLGVVRNTAYVMKRKLAQGDVSKAGEYLDMIEQELISVERILKELAGLGHAEPPKRQATALTAIIAAARDRLPPYDKIQWQCSADDLVLNVDPEQFAVVFRHLFANAAQAMGGAGMIAVQADRAEDADEVFVTDTGPGISAENLQRVFEPLFSGRPRRAGLGLTVSRRIVERHSGTLEALPHTGGAQIRLRLPRL